MQKLSIHYANQSNEKAGKFIIGIKDGVAMVKYPNKKNFRIEAAADGFDLITVDEEQADLIWKQSINLNVEIVDLTALDRKV